MKATTQRILRRFCRLCFIAFPATIASFASQIRAEPIFGISGGYAMGTLVRSAPETFTTSPVQGFIGYNYWKLSARAFFQHAQLDYTYENESFSGTYGLSGIALAYSGLVTEFGKFTFILEAPLTGSLILLSESTGSVNGFDYIHSSLVTLSGTMAYQVFAGYEFSARGRGMLRRGGNIYYGIYAGYLKHSFSQQTTRIRTNNSILAPISPGTETVAYDLTMMSLLFSGTYDL